MLLHSYLCDAWFYSNQNGIQKSIENEIQNSFTKWKRNSPLSPPLPWLSACSPNQQRLLLVSSPRPNGHDGPLASPLASPFVGRARCSPWAGPC
jgi:hypothetical protein